MQDRNSRRKVEGRVGQCRRLFFVAVMLWLPMPDSDGVVQVRNERWRWSNPLPHGNNVMDMFVGKDVAVQVGDGGSIYVRHDTRWAPAVSGVTNYMRSAVMLGGRFLATGENGCILWSDDGQGFNAAQLDPATSDWLEGVAASSQQAVAVGDFGAVYVSTNGTGWTRAVSGTAEWLRGVAYGSGIFVAVGENGKILRSANGTNWGGISSGTGEHLNRVRYLGVGPDARFIAVGNNGVMLSSATGLSPWTMHATGTTNALYDVALNDHGLLLVGDQEIRFQADGEPAWSEQINDLASNAPPAWLYLSAGSESNNWLVAGQAGLLMQGTGSNGNDYAWNTLLDSSHAWIWDVTVQKGIYVAVGDLANIQTSLDGILWAREVVPVSHTNTVFLGVGGTSNLLIAVGNDGTVLASHAGSTTIAVTNEVDGEWIVTNLTVEALGVVWSNVPAFTTNNLQGVAASDSLVLVCGDNGTIFASANGADWTARSTPVTGFLSGIAIGPSACVAVGANGVLIHAAADGTGWSRVFLNTDDWLYKVRWIDNQFVVVGENGRIYTSPDGAEWTSRTSGSAQWLTDVTRVEDRWFVTGFQGTLLTSSNRVSWSRLPLPTIKSLFAASSRDGQLVVAGIEGVILRNQVVPQLSPVNILSYKPTIVANPDSTKSLYEIFLLGGMPDQFFELQSTINLSDTLWSGLAEFELYHASGTLYLLRYGDVSTAPHTETYRTQLLP